MPSPSRSRVRGAAGLLATVSLAISGVVAVTATTATADEPAPSFAQCPDAFPAADLTPGLEATGLTVTGNYQGGVNGPDAGTAPQQFKATYVDTLEDSTGDLYVFDLEGLNITKPNGDLDAGVWAGISGSPVYASDGRLIGSVSYTFIDGVTNRAGITPATALYDARDRATGGTPDTIRLSKKQQAALVKAGGNAAGNASTSTLHRLTPPTIIGGVKGVSDRALATFAKRSRLANPVVGGGQASAAKAPTEVVAGGNVGFAISYGDIPLYSVGTAAAVCDDTVVAYGHPDYFEPYQRTMHTATAIGVEKSTFGSFKLANLGPAVGSVVHDGLDAVIGTVGKQPVGTEVVTSTTGAKPRTSTTKVLEPEAVGYVAAVQTARDIALAFDSDRGGEALSTFTIDYVADGKPGQIQRTNRFSSPSYLSEAVPNEVAQSIYLLQDQEFKDLTITKVQVDTTTSPTYRAYKIGALKVRTANKWVDVKRGTAVKVAKGRYFRVKAALNPAKGAKTSVTPTSVEYRIKASSSRGNGFLRFSGSDGDYYDDEDYYEDEEDYYYDDGGDEFSTFAEVLAFITSAARNDDVTAVWDRSTAMTAKTTEKRFRQGAVVTGFGSVRLSIR